MTRVPSYAAILLDLDGTLVNDQGSIPERTLNSLSAAHRRGVCVMIATGRSELATVDVLKCLEIDNLAVVYNGAGVYCPKRSRLVEEQILSGRTVARALAFADDEDLMVVAMRGGAKFATAPRTAAEAAAIRDMRGLSICEDGVIPDEYLMRVTLFSLDPDHAALAERVRAFVERPVYMTSFPLSMLAGHRESPMSVVDLHAPCRGKAEALRLLEQHYGIKPRQVVAVGDAMNDVPMLEGAGLGVAMKRSSSEALAVADRVIGDNNSETIGELVDELFG